MKAPLPVPSLLGLTALVAQSMLFGILELAYAERTKALETVRGAECYRFGDEETPAKARHAAMALAQEQAIRSYGVFVRSSSLLKNYQMEEDIIQTASSAMLHDIKIEKEERKPQEICITLSAKISPVSVEDMIKQRVGAKEITEAVKTTAVPSQPKFGLRVWTNKPDGRFSEGEKLIVYVQSERDAYLKLDYFQADGKVAHLVPNIYRGQAFITGGKTYSFGDETSPEQYIINEPYGAEAIKAITGVQPFEAAADEADPTGDSRNYLGRLRGIKVVAASSSVELNTKSRAVAEYKKEPPKHLSLP